MSLVQGAQSPSNRLMPKCVKQNRTARQNARGLSVDIREMIFLDIGNGRDSFICEQYAKTSIDGSPSFVKRYARLAAQPSCPGGFGAYAVSMLLIGVRIEANSRPPQILPRS